MINTTLCYIEDNDKYLMLYRNKKKKDINKNKWIGLGGHVEENETIEECLVREVYEESGLIIKDYKLRGKIIFYIDDIVETSYLFTSNNFSGTLKECNEGELSWVPKKDLFKLPMWEADPLFLKKLLNNEPFFVMELVYKNDILISYKVED